MFRENLSWESCRCLHTDVPCRGAERKGSSATCNQPSGAFGAVLKRWPTLRRNVKSTPSYLVSLSQLPFPRRNRRNPGQVEAIMRRCQYKEVAALSANIGFVQSDGDALLDTSESYVRICFCCSRQNPSALCRLRPRCGSTARPPCQNQESLK